MLEPGFELRKEWTLELLLRHHKNWKKMRNITEGVAYELEELSEHERTQDLTAMVTHGNHKSASDKHNEPTLLKKLLD